MFCPVCHCEYVAGITVCADCQVPLVPELSGGASTEPELDAPWTLVWSGGDPGRREELRAALEEEQIPARSSQEGGLLNLAAYESFDVYVPTPLVPKATEILREIAVAEEEWRRKAGTGVLELPAEEDVESDAPASELSEPAAEWHADDATSEIWSGDNAALTSMIAASLRENRINFRTDPEETVMENASDSRPQAIFVAPEDEVRAKGIVRQIVDAAAGDL